jgi:hypothetical protein
VSTKISSYSDQKDLNIIGSVKYDYLKVRTGEDVQRGAKAADVGFEAHEKPIGPRKLSPRMAAMTRSDVICVASHH